MHDVTFTGFHTLIRESNNHAVTMLGYASVVVAKGLCTQAAHITHSTGGARGFDSGAWALTCSVRRINKTGEILVEVPSTQSHGGMYYDAVKLAKGVREQILHTVAPYLPTEEEITTMLKS